MAVSIDPAKMVKPEYNHPLPEGWQDEWPKTPRAKKGYTVGKPLKGCPRIPKADGPNGIYFITKEVQRAWIIDAAGIILDAYDFRDFDHGVFDIFVKKVTGQRARCYMRCLLPFGKEQIADQLATWVHRRC